MKFKNTMWGFLIAVCSLQFIAASAQKTTLINPILSGFYPDPSIVKVGADYYLVNSTFSYFPGLPIWHSKDLKNWKQIGNVINRTSQMDFQGERMTRGLFAPGISYHKGLFYLTCTDIDHEGNFVVTAKDPAGPWSNPVKIPEVKGIDPSIFFDDNDNAFIVYNSDAPEYKPLYSGHRTIRMYAFDPLNLKVIGEEKILVNGGVDISKKPVWIEGPHFLQKNGWYYLYAAEGGTSVNHTEVVFRSKSVFGPFIPYEKNPILTQRDLPADRKNPITSTGHAQFVEGPDGKTYAIFLACRPYIGDYYNTGRETFIAPVEWTNDWPVIIPENNAVNYSYNTTIQESKQTNALPQSGNFSYTLKFDKKLDPALVFMRSADSSSFSCSKSGGLTLKLKPETISELGIPSFIGKRQQHLNASAETELVFTPNNENEAAGLAIFQNESHFYFLSKTIKNGSTVLELLKSNKDKKNNEILASVPLVASNVYLKIVAAGEFYQFYYATNLNDWKLLKNDVDAKFLSTQVAGGFIGCFFGMYATSNGITSNNSASFKYLKYAGNDPFYK